MMACPAIQRQTNFSLWPNGIILLWGLCLSLGCLYDIHLASGVKSMHHKRLLGLVKFVFHNASCSYVNGNNNHNNDKSGTVPDTSPSRAVMDAGAEEGTESMVIKYSFRHHYQSLYTRVFRDKIYAHAFLYTHHMFIYNTVFVCARKRRIKRLFASNVAIRFMGRIIILQSAVIVVAAAITVATYTLNNIHWTVYTIDIWIFHVVYMVGGVGEGFGPPHRTVYTHTPSARAI